MDENVQRHDEPLPETFDEVMAYLKEVLILPSVLKVEVTPKLVSVFREVREGEPVVPTGDREEGFADVGFIIQSVELTNHMFEPEEHPYTSLEKASRTLTEQKLSVTHILASDDELLSAWLDLDYTPEEGNRVFGMKVMFPPSELLEGRVLLLGSPSSAGLLADATHGIVIDMGM